MSFRDVVVLLPGITGSVLVRNGKEVWSLTAASVWRAISTFGGSITDLELGGPGEVIAVRLMDDTTLVPGFFKIDGYTRIEKYLISQLGLETGRNYFPFPYDWRLDNRIHAELLNTLAREWLRKWRQSSGAADARLVLIAHSMGGLISRYFLECLEGWTITRTLITIGTPHQGSLNAVDFLVHGMKKGIGPFGIDLAPLLRSFPSVYQLLPIYRCIDSEGRGLLSVTDAADARLLPHVNPAAVRKARAFHQQIEDAQSSNAKQSGYASGGYKSILLVGIEQPTLQSSRCTEGRVEMLRNFNGTDDGGDGTVPRVSATPIELEHQGREVFAAEMHGSLQNGDGVLANLHGILRKPVTDLSRYRAEIPPPLTLDVDDVVAPDEPVIVRARASEGNPQISAVLTPLDGASAGVPVKEMLGRSPDGEWRQSEFDLDGGRWRIRIEAEGAMPVTEIVAVATR